MRKLLVGGLGAVALAAVVMTAYAPASNAQMDLIKERQDTMKAIGGGMKKLGDMAKGAMAYDAAAVSEAGNAMAEHFAKLATLVPEGSISDESYAKPEIWQDMAGFTAAREKAEAAAKSLAATSDEAGFKAALGDLGGACKGCHEKFRRPKS